jgi:hypothetical protein
MQHMRNALHTAFNAGGIADIAFDKLKGSLADR